MAKVSIDIEYVKDSLSKIGYVISDCIKRDNNGLIWQLKFSNSGASVTIYDTNTKKNSVVNGKCEEEEKESLKAIVDEIKCKEASIDPINETIVKYINSKKEMDIYDFKQEWHSPSKDGDLLHDILSLANNENNEDAYLIIGVTDDHEVVGVKEWKKSNDIYDFLRSKKFAGGHIPTVELKKVYYKYYKIDVLVIKHSHNVPFFLTKQYKDVGIQIYTRVGDTNTPKNEMASYDVIEKLWKIHFKE